MKKKIYPEYSKINELFFYFLFFFSSLKDRLKTRKSVIVDVISVVDGGLQQS